MIIICILLLTIQVNQHGIYSKLFFIIHNKLLVTSHTNKERFLNRSKYGNNYIYQMTKLSSFVMQMVDYIHHYSYLIFVYYTVCYVYSSFHVSPSFCYLSRKKMKWLWIFQNMCILYNMTQYTMLYRTIFSSKANRHFINGWWHF